MFNSIAHTNEREQMLTYEDLASTPTRINLSESTYSHVTQIGSGAHMNVTFNGTQTFDFNGHPKDSDQD